MARLIVAVVLAGAAAVALIAVVGGDADTAAPRFTTRIDNPYLPMRPGTRRVYRETAEDGSVQRVVVKVTNRTKRVAAGIVGRVVRDTVTQNGQVVEDTFDWYAQDRDGNVWYLGEDTTEYEHGKPVSKEGSWEAGVDGAQPGIVMLAHPKVGREYGQEHYPGHAEDRARVLSRDEQVEVPAGHYAGVLLTREWNPLEPKVLEYKLYAKGVGVVLTLGISGDLDREELLPQ